MSKLEQTLSIIKPDAVERNLTEEIKSPENQKQPVVLSPAVRKIVDEIIAINSIGVINFAESIDTVQRKYKKVKYLPKRTFLSLRFQEIKKLTCIL